MAPPAFFLYVLLALFFLIAVQFASGLSGQEAS